MFNRETFRTRGPTIEVKVHGEETKTPKGPNNKIVRGEEVKRDRMAGGPLCRVFAWEKRKPR